VFTAAFEPVKKQIEAMQKPLALNRPTFSAVAAYAELHL
jgi:hypothetical protein